MHPRNRLPFLPQMWKFTQSRWVVRKEVAAVTKVSAAVGRRPGPSRWLPGLWGSPLSCPQLCTEDVKDFLEHMAVVRVNKGWEFILPSDGDFIKKHPDVVQRQHMLWTGIQAK